MGWSKTSKVWAVGVGGGLLAVGGGLLVMTGVGVGAGAVLITSGLATIGGVVGGGMLAGVGVIAAGSATAAALAAATAQKLIKDPELVKLAAKLQQANELYAVAHKKSASQTKEIEELNRIVGKLIRAQASDREQIAALRERLAILIDRLRKGD